MISTYGASPNNEVMPMASQLNDHKRHLYFVDGFHGGTWGHMPPGAWRDIVEALSRYPEWKISLDIEPISWQTVRREDPYSYRRLRELLSDSSPQARVEMLAASYAQPFAWAISGESNIRHLLRGRELVEDHFPEAVVDTYALQEPCWTSSMPQILQSLGFKRAALKNPTAWGGYFAGFDADQVLVEGPDGSKIPTVPRYASEDLVGCHAVESAGYQLLNRDGSETSMRSFVDKCIRNGISRPSGMCLQDLGWRAKPWLEEDLVRHVTWREYFLHVAPDPSETWQFSQEDVRCVLPWGERTLQKLAREVRRAENRVIQAEKMAALATALRAARYPQQALQEAWDRLLYSQHHDIWICATTREGRKSWSWQADHATARAEELSDEIIEQALEALQPPRSSALTASNDGETAQVLVVNTLGRARQDIAEATLVLPVGTRAVELEEPGGRRVPVQLRPMRFYGDGSLNTARVTFSARSPGFGLQTYLVKPVPEERKPQPGVRVETAEDAVVIESDLYKIVLDPKRGGVIRSLYHKELDWEFSGAGETGGGFNEYRGYFIDEQQWLSSADSRVKIEVLESGPVRARVQMSGKIGKHRFRTLIGVAKGERIIDFQVRFDFRGETWVGDPWEVPAEDRRTERRRSHHDDRWKLHASFPMPVRQPELYKDAPFDVCRSRHQDTLFQSWDEIKHNVLLNWVDLFDAHSGFGLGVLSDHTTSYSYGDDHPLALTLGWGWEGGFWWGKCPLRGRQEVRYALIPHRGRWDEAQLAWDRARWSEPFVVGVGHGDVPASKESQALFELSRSGFELTSAFVQDGDLLLRIFNAEGEDESCELLLHRRPHRAELTELDGRSVRELAVTEKNGAYQVALELPRFGLRTVRLCGLAPDHRKG